MTWEKVAAGKYVNAAGVQIEGDKRGWWLFDSDGTGRGVAWSLAEAKELAADIPDYRER